MNAHKDVLDLGIYCQKYQISLADLKKYRHDEEPVIENDSSSPAKTKDEAYARSVHLTQILTKYCVDHNIGIVELHSIAHEKIHKEYEDAHEERVKARKKGRKKAFDL